MEPSSAGLEVQNAVKSFGQTRALDGVTLQVFPGEVVALLGPSGSGKSTLLYAVAGLEALDSGDLLWNGLSLQNVPPHRRGFGLMFQDFALFPHMNVYENVAFGLSMLHFDPSRIQSRVSDMLTLIGLSGFELRDVNTLSGGEQQRVALARSLAPQPRLLMLDEPLGSLDRNLRERLVLDLREILRSMQQTAIYVTHDQEEAFVLADRVAVLQAGRLEQFASPQELYRNPNSLFVARFLGLTNLLPGRIKRESGRSTVETALGDFPVDSSNGYTEVTVLIRPDELHLGGGKGPAEIEGVVVDRTFRGSMCRLTIDSHGIPLTLDFLSGIDLPEPGKSIRLSFDPAEAIQILPDRKEAG